MSETVWAAIITVGGMLTTTVATSLIHWRTTKFLISAERDKIIAGASHESLVRRTERKCDKILELVARLASISNPDMNEKIDYPAAVSLMYQIELLLDLKIDQEAALKTALDDLCTGIEDRHRDTGQAALIALDRVIEAARSVSRNYYGATAAVSP